MAQAEEICAARGQRLTPIPGSPPSLIELPAAFGRQEPDAEIREYLKYFKWHDERGGHAH